MALSAFEDPGTSPATPALEAVLGAAAPHWAALIAEVSERSGGSTQLWRHGGTRNGWTLRLLRGDRVLAYLTPQAGRMLVGVVLGEKAIDRAQAAGFASRATMAVVDAAPRYAEGRGVRLEVRTDADLAIARELVRIKLGT
jgi:hypothetical protein